MQHSFGFALRIALWVDEEVEEERENSHFLGRLRWRCYQALSLSRFADGKQFLYTMILKFLRDIAAKDFAMSLFHKNSTCQSHFVDHPCHMELSYKRRFHRKHLCHLHQNDISLTKLWYLEKAVKVCNYYYINYRTVPRGKKLSFEAKQYNNCGNNRSIT